MKYDKEQREVKINVLRKNYSVSLTEDRYEQFKNVVYEFFEQPQVVPEDWKSDVEICSYLKTAMKIGLIYTFKNEPTHLSPYVQALLENKCKDFYRVKDDLDASRFVFVGLKNNEIQQFFTTHGLMEGTKEITIYFNNEINQAPLNSLCVVETEANGLIIFNKVDDLSVEDILQEGLKGKVDVIGSFAKTIFPIHILLGYIDTVTNAPQTFKIINMDGSIDEIFPAEYFRKTHSYYNRPVKTTLTGFSLVEKFEQIIQQKFSSKITFNDVFFAEQNQYATAQYRVSLHMQFQKEVAKFLAVSESYIMAAERGIRYGIGEILTKNEKIAVWVSDLDEQEYYIRALLKFVKDESISLYVLDELDPDVQRLKKYVEKQTGEVYNIILHAVLDEAVGWVSIVNQDYEVIYKSISSVRITSEITTGFHTLLMQHMNNISLSSGAKLKVDLIERRALDSFKAVNKMDFLNDLRSLLGNRKITEKVWLHEQAFDSVGMFVGKFMEEGQIDA
jgi:hypothetical protein